MANLREEFTSMVIAKKAAMIDDSLREALGKWVSEIEPELVMSGSGAMLGIGAIGHGNLIIPVRKTEIVLTYAGEEYARI